MTGGIIVIWLLAGFSGRLLRKYNFWRFAESIKVNPKDYWTLKEEILQDFLIIFGLVHLLIGGVAYSYRPFIKKEYSRWGFKI